MERVLGVLQEQGMKFPVIALAREQKVPAHDRAPSPNPNPYPNPNPKPNRKPNPNP